METTRTIEAYLDGSLDRAERADLEARATRDPEFADLIRLHKEVNESIRDEGGSKLKAKLYKIEIDLHESQYGNLLRIAALFIVVLSVYTIIRICILHSVIGQSIYDKYYLKYQPDIIFRSTITTASLLDNAILQYESGNYIQCKQLLDSILVFDKDNYTACFFLGLTCLELHTPLDAIDAFEVIPEKWNSQYSIHRDWYLGLSLLKAGRYKESNSIMKKLYANSGYYSKKSKSITRKLRI